MTLGQARNSSRWDTTRGIHAARFRWKPAARGIGYVDGAWWPHSDDLMTQLPDLIAVLSMRLGAISCVMYNNTEWRITPAELVSGGHVVKLDGHRGHPPNTVEVLDSKGNKYGLLVVPFHLDPDQAHRIVMAAAAPGDVSSVDTLLMISVEDRESRTRRDAARERWEFATQGKTADRRERPRSWGGSSRPLPPMALAPPSHHS
ncbi:hypothetical protein MMAN_04740 [Mycobacterium mantenii]|uniref:Uncharacterized protein n=1 Tax=Mycobacterium mantenii TaxID=560555 RepID=A0ABM7JLG5_MYCNT|nr:hypothetical protein MMAN_04740 [Mycobacterium mantenii]